MEQMTANSEHRRNSKLDDLERVFGNDGSKKLISQISHDNPSLTEDGVIDHAWSLIPEATAYAMPASQEDLAHSAINIHEGYEAFRRTAE